MFGNTGFACAGRSGNDDDLLLCVDGHKEAAKLGKKLRVRVRLRLRLREVD
jgi:hypothetical protein